MGKPKNRRAEVWSKYIKGIIDENEKNRYRVNWSIMVGIPALKRKEDKIIKVLKHEKIIVYRE